MCYLLRRQISNYVFFFKPSTTSIITQAVALAVGHINNYLCVWLKSLWLSTVWAAFPGGEIVLNGPPVETAFPEGLRLHDDNCQTSCCTFNPRVPSTGWGKSTKVISGLLEEEGVGGGCLKMDFKEGPRQTHRHNRVHKDMETVWEWGGVGGQICVTVKHYMSVS